MHILTRTHTNTHTHSHACEHNQALKWMWLRLITAASVDTAPLASVIGMTTMAVMVQASVVGKFAGDEDIYRAARSSALWVVSH